MSQFKDFTPELWSALYKQIEEAVSSPGPHYAAFDADGTLWDNDAGNAFFDFQIDNKLVPLPDNAWEHVYEIKKESPNKCFLWLAQVNKGVPVQTVRDWASAAYKKNTGFNYFPAVKKLIAYLHSKNVQVLVITASVKWAVEPCVEELGIKYENVLGVQTKIQDGIVTDIQEGPVTYREGKAIALLEKTKGITPILVAGNTMGDFFMLELAKIKLALRSVNDNLAFKDKDISNQEIDLYEEAKHRGWFTHNFGE